ncbi:helix-turn-helix transcriptional regulator [Serratia marcescens]|uniref:helix-turn-helix transcriptional regulator n=1 Tax=Serratia marcescens TaxID=615 RepID=UPI0016611D01|nr:helix-turn-helix transcriptional regulator [Serratia marcescens]MBH3170347.1 helix-turn-helix transcriptional regulator [Serratia marcescens]
MNNISCERKKMGLSQSLLANEIGWKRSRLSNYEIGLRSPSLDECRLIVETMNRLGCDCTLDSLFPPQEEAGKTEA